MSLHIIKLISLFLLMGSIQSCIKASSSKVSSEQQEEPYAYYLYGYQDGNICQYKCKDDEGDPPKHPDKECDIYYEKAESSGLNENILKILENPSEVLKEWKPISMNDMKSLYFFEAKQKVTGDICNNAFYHLDSDSEYGRTDEVAKWKSLIKVKLANLTSISPIEKTNDTWDKYSNGNNTIFLYKKNKNTDTYVLLSNGNLKHNDSSSSETNKLYCAPREWKGYGQKELKMFFGMQEDINKNLEYLGLKEVKCLYIPTSPSRCLSIGGDGYGGIIIGEIDFDSKTRLFVCDVIKLDTQKYLADFIMYVEKVVE